jgi:hypothetical protein
MSTKMYGVVTSFVKICESNTLLWGTQEFISVIATLLHNLGEIWYKKSAGDIVEHLFVS